MKKGWVTLSNGVEVNDNGQGFMRLHGELLGSDLIDVNNTTQSQEWQKDENGLEYKTFPFRMLSKRFIEGYSLDFSEGDVLRESIDLFKTKIFKNHDTKIENSIGIVLSVAWDGDSQVPGVNGVYKIFRKFGENIADRLEADVLDSTSVGVRFLWKKSHPNLSGFSFFSELGQKIDNEVVRLIITKILSVPETSIVYSGADSMAKKLHNVKQVPSYNSDLLLGDLKTTIHKERELEEFTKAKEELKALKFKYKEAEELIEQLKTDKENITKEAALKERFYKLGEKTEKNLREKAIANYRLITGENAKAEMLEQLQNGTMETVEFLSDEFQKKLEELHPVRCPNCNEKLTRASSAENKDFNPGGKQDEKAKTRKFKIK